MQNLGLYFDRPFLRLALVESKPKQVKIISLKSLNPVAADDVKRLYMQNSSAKTAIALSTLLRQCFFKISSLKQIKQILPSHIESLIAIKPEEIIYSARHRAVEEGTESTIFVTSKENLNHHLQEWKTISIFPDSVTSVAAALLKFIQYRCPDLNSAYIIHLGSQEWVFIWIENGELRKSFTLDEGIESILASLWEDRKKVLFQKEVEGVAKQIDLLQLKTHLNPHLSEQLEKLRNKLNGVLSSFQKIGGNKPVFFTGRTDAFGSLREYLLETVEGLFLYEPPLPIAQDEIKCAIAIGAALENEVQFLKDDFIPEKTWKKAGRGGIFLLLSSLLFAAILAIAGHSKFQTEKEWIASSIQKLLSKADKKMSISLFSQGIEEGVDAAFSIIQKYDKDTPYILESPTVSAVLSWISSHPIVAALLNTDDPIEILEMKYQLASYPHIGSLREAYRAKVDLEFRVKSPMSARKFHESLLEGDAFVDPQEEVTWDSSIDTYRTSFYLKNKASHGL